MNTTYRIGKIIALLKEANEAMAGSALADLLAVSRQTIAKDIDTLRSEGVLIQSTAKGYLLTPSPVYCMAVCRHDAGRLLEQEVFAIIEGDGALMNVLMDHPIYGVVCENLMVYSARGAQRYIHAVQSGVYRVAPVGVHTHTVCAPDEHKLHRILEKLKMLGILIE